MEEIKALLSPESAQQSRPVAPNFRGPASTSRPPDGSPVTAPSGVLNNPRFPGGAGVRPPASPPATPAPPRTKEWWSNAIRGNRPPSPPASPPASPPVSPPASPPGAPPLSPPPASPPPPPATPVVPSPLSLLAQLYGNAGQMGAPMMPTGAVQMPSAGQNFDPFTYGQSGGEAMWYSRTPQGQMAPISALLGLGAPRNWNPPPGQNPYIPSPPASPPGSPPVSPPPSPPTSGPAWYTMMQNGRRVHVESDGAGRWRYRYGEKGNQNIGPWQTAALPTGLGNPVNRPRK